MFSVYMMATGVEVYTSYKSVVLDNFDLKRIDQNRLISLFKGGNWSDLSENNLVSVASETDSNGEF